MQFHQKCQPSAFNSSCPKKSLSDYLMNSAKSLSLGEIMEEIGTYMLGKVSLASTQPDSVLINLQDYLSILRPSHTEKSNVHYLCVLDAVADNKDTLTEILHDLHCKYVKTNIHQHLVIEGDAKLYAVLQSLKYKYAKDLEWLIPFQEIGIC